MISYELGQAFRSIRRGGGVSLAVMLILGLGIGIATTFFSFLDAAFLRQLPFPAADRLIAVTEIRGRVLQHGSVSIQTFKLAREHVDAFSDVGAYRRSRFRIANDELAVYASGAFVTPGFLRFFGVEPIRGTLPDYESVDTGVVLSHSLWQGAFGSDPDILRQRIRVNGASLKVSAIMPAGFGFPHSQRLWIADRTLAEGADDEFLKAVAVLAPGASPEEGRRELDDLEHQLADIAGGNRLSQLRLHESVVNRQKGFWVVPWMLFACGIILLLLVTSNVASLVTAWHARRRGDTAIRTALGASRGRLVRQALTESIILALGGGAHGLILAWLGRHFLLSFFAANFPSWFELRFDVRVLAFTAVISLATVILFGLLPALRTARTGLMPILKNFTGGVTAGRVHHRLRERSAVVQIAFTVLFLSSTMLMLATARGLNDVDPGYPASEILEIRLDLQERLQQSPAELTRLVREYRAEIENFADVTAASFEGNFAGIRGKSGNKKSDDPIDYRLFSDGNWLLSKGISRAAPHVVSSEYFELMGLPMVDGRGFSPEDTPGRTLAGIIPSSLADKIWPGTSAIGRVLTIGKDGPPVRIVGVVTDRKIILSGRDGVRIGVIQNLYISNSQAYVKDPRVLARTDGDPLELVPRVEAALAAIDSRQSVYSAETLEERFNLTTSISRDISSIFLFFAGGGLLISVIGLFGLVNQLVAERKREIGIRMAVGASASAVIHAITRKGLRITLLGAGLGLLLSFAAWPILSIFVYQISIWDPTILLIVLGSILATGWAASYIPARKAANIDPVESLATR